VYFVVLILKLKPVRNSTPLIIIDNLAIGFLQLGNPHVYNFHYEIAIYSLPSSYLSIKWHNIEFQMIFRSLIF